MMDLYKYAYKYGGNMLNMEIKSIRAKTSVIDSVSLFDSSRIRKEYKVLDHFFEHFRVFDDNINSF